MEAAPLIVADHQHNHPLRPTDSSCDDMILINNHLPDPFGKPIRRVETPAGTGG
jgi:hypothetical protein